MGTDTVQLSRPLGARVHGTALVLYFALLPYVVLSKWQRTSSENSGSLIRALLIVLALFWLGFLCQVVRNVWRLRQGRRVNSGGSAWLAGLVVAMLALALPTHVPAHEPTAISITHHSTSRDAHHRLPTPLIGLSPLPLALMAKRRNDLLRQPEGEGLFDVDESIEMLRSLNSDLIGHLVALIGDASDGVLDVPDSPPPAESATPRTPMIACTLGPSATGTLVGFAREGGRLPIRASWNADDIQRQVVALHDGTVTFARNEPELLRALATRTLRESVVLYLGPAIELDDELSACAITLTPYLEHETRVPIRTVMEAPRSTDLRIELLRADPSVVGMVEPFTPTLRRRCVEMVAYLALHRHEPVTGERLRTRVLVHADVEASTRTLANTASAVRRSLGYTPSRPRVSTPRTASRATSRSSPRSWRGPVNSPSPTRRLSLMKHSCSFRVNRSRVRCADSNGFSPKGMPHDWPATENGRPWRCTTSLCNAVTTNWPSGRSNKAFSSTPTVTRCVRRSRGFRGYASLAAMEPALRSTSPSAPAAL